MNDLIHKKIAELTERRDELLDSGRYARFDQEIERRVGLIEARLRELRAMRDA